MRADCCEPTRWARRSLACAEDQGRRAASVPDLIGRRLGFISELRAAVPLGVIAERMAELARAIDVRVDDVVRELAAGRVQPQLIPHFLCNFMVGAGSIAADA